MTWRGTISRQDKRLLQAETKILRHMPVKSIEKAEVGTASVRTEENLGHTETDRRKMMGPKILDFIEGIERGSRASRRTERRVRIIDDGIEVTPEIGEERGTQTGNTGHVLVPQESIELKNLDTTTYRRSVRSLPLLCRTRKDLIDRTAACALLLPEIEMPRRVRRQQRWKNRKEHPIPIHWTK